MRKFVRWSATVVFVLIVSSALVGPLFPWSPVKPGYEHLALARADVYYPFGAALDPAYRNIDWMIAETEDFHRLKMPERITVIASRDWNDFHLKVPWIRGNAVAAVTLLNGTAILVTPKIAEKHFDTGEFLRHELSHAILAQNSTLWRGYKLGQEQWFFEGIAVANGRQKSYLTPEEFVARAQEIPAAFNGNSSDMRFNYVAWRYFLEYMMRTRGRDTFQSFMLDAMQGPENLRGVFRGTFKISLDDAIAEFTRNVSVPLSLPAAVN